MPSASARFWLNPKTAQRAGNCKVEAGLSFEPRRHHPGRPSAVRTGSRIIRCERRPEKHLRRQIAPMLMAQRTSGRDWLRGHVLDGRRNVFVASLALNDDEL